MGLKVIVAQRETRHCVAQVPAMKGCSSQGATREEAGANAREAAALWLEVEQSKPTAGRAGPRD